MELAEQTSSAPWQVAIRKGESIFVGLWRDDGKEVVGGGYARVAVKHWVFEADCAFNRDELRYPVPTTDWGFICGLAFFREASGGRPMTVRSLTSSKHVLRRNAAPSFQPRSLSVGMGMAVSRSSTL